MDYQVSVAQESLYLLPEKALLWPSKQFLVISDLHIGKANHFRKAGIAVPKAVNHTNLRALTRLVLRTQPERVLFLGDLFHSDPNREWQAFVQWMKQFPDIRFELVIGNHDILPATFYEEAGVHCYPEGLQIGPFWLTHEPQVDPTKGYNLAGHIHPGVRLSGKGRQSLRLPCFWFGEQQSLLPAFGAFTGLHRIEPKAEERVFVIANEKVIPLASSATP